MIMKKRFIKTLTTIGAVTILLMPFSAAERVVFAMASKSKIVDAGSIWVVNETTSLTSLTIDKDAVIKAPDKHCITMTIDRIETAIEPGVYKGDIVLTVTNEIQNPIVMGGGTEGDVGGGGGGASAGVRAAIYVDGGVYVPEKSVPTAMVKGNVTDNSATDVTITSIGKDFNGIIVTGDSTYSINNPKINFKGGDQGNNGAGITSSGNADVTVNNALIISKGVQRAAIVVGGNSTMHVNDSYIEAHDGTLPEKFAKMEDSNSMEVPWVLGFIGNNRATNVVNNGTAYYKNTYIKAQRWGCLSTDACQDVKLYVTNCKVETVESGYGSYADGSTNVFSGTTFNVNDYGFIMTGGSGTFTDGCVVNSARFGVMSHQGSGTVTIDKGTVFNTKRAVLQVKGGHPTFIVDDAQLNSESGVILQAIVNDDPWASGMPGSAGRGPGGPAGGPGGSKPGSAEGSAVVTATFRNATLKGDMVTSMTSKSDVVVNLEKATVTGAITTASAKAQADIDGVKISKANYKYIGEIKNTYCATDDKFGMKVSLDGKSRWVVDKNSYLTGLIISKGAVITAPDGYTLTMTVNGIKKEIKAGKYSGKIGLTIGNLGS
jgi:hypothetical protein